MGLFLISEPSRVECVWRDHRREEECIAGLGKQQVATLLDQQTLGSDDCSALMTIASFF